MQDRPVDEEREEERTTGTPAEDSPHHLHDMGGDIGAASLGTATRTEPGGPDVDPRAMAVSATDDATRTGMAAADETETAQIGSDVHHFGSGDRERDPGSAGLPGGDSGLVVEMDAPGPGGADGDSGPRRRLREEGEA